MYPFLNWLKNISVTARRLRSLSISFRRLAAVPLFCCSINYIAESKACLGGGSSTILCLCGVEAGGAHTGHLEAPVEQGDDPLPHLGQIRLAPCVNQCWRRRTPVRSDRMLAYAMTLALPPSYAPIQQTCGCVLRCHWPRLWGHQAEWARRKLSKNPSGALIAKQTFGQVKRDLDAVNKDRLYGADQNAF